MSGKRVTPSTVSGLSVRSYSGGVSAEYSSVVNGLI